MKDPVIVNLNNRPKDQESAERRQEYIDSIMGVCIEKVIKVMTYHDYSTAIETLGNDELGQMLQIAVLTKNENLIGKLFLKVLRENEEVNILATHMAETEADK